MSNEQSARVESITETRQRMARLEAEFFASNARMDSRISVLEERTINTAGKVSEISRQMSDLKENIKEEVGTLRDDMKENVAWLHTEISRQREEVSQLRVEVKEMGRALTEGSARLSGSISSVHEKINDHTLQDSKNTAKILVGVASTALIGLGGYIIQYILK
jgi:chromosome segregation ATPase